MKDTQLPQPGTNAQGEKYNKLPVGSDYPNPPKLDLGKTHGTQHDQEELAGLVGGVVQAGSELVKGAVNIAETLMEPAHGEDEDAWGTSARPMTSSAMDTYNRKFGGQ
jgi:hypothetical protein